MFLNNMIYNITYVLYIYDNTLHLNMLREFKLKGGIVLAGRRKFNVWRETYIYMDHNSLGKRMQTGYGEETI